MDGAGELHRCIVGFVNIESEHIIKDIATYKKTKILIVDGEKESCEQIKSIVDKKYKCLEASSGQQALDILFSHYREIGLILTDLKIHDSDGLEFISILKNDEDLNKIPIIVQSTLEDDATKVKCIDLGATDFINKPYKPALVMNRVESVLKLNELSDKLRHLEIDSHTDFYTREAFYEYAQRILDRNPEKDYIIEIADIVGFKAINEQYGKMMGDQILRFVSTIISENLEGFIIGGRLSGDSFAIIRPDKVDYQPDDSGIVKEINATAPIPNLVIKFGIFRTKTARDITSRQMCDRAKIALNSVKRTYGKNYCIFDDSMRIEFMEEQNILDTMESALENKEFEVYYQPKHSIVNKKLTGAEALVRWNHKEQGFMNPAKFIPIFENNGFITKLDKYVWRRTCEDISQWYKKGYNFPISINVSRKDFLDQNIADFIITLVDEYEIPHNLLHIEVTESAFIANPRQMEYTVKKLHDNGFSIELDDFGSGYSSITSLNKMDIDIIKMDMSIIRDDKKGAKKNALEFSMQLANMMGIKTIQEGVETEEQFLRVKELGCDYVQGYYFSKPLNKSAFDEYIVKNVENNQ